MLKKNKKQNDEPLPENAQGENTNPMFFSKPHVITLDRHAKAKLRNGISLDFALKTNSIPLTMADIPEAAKHYPLAFTQDERVIPVAIVGLEQENYFIDSEGKWAEGLYVPSYVRKYPFIFMEMPDSDQLTLCIDEAALTFDEKDEGMALYEGDKPTAFTSSALEFCAAHHEQYKLTEAFGKALRERDMLVPQRSDITLASGKTIQLAGFQLIDTEKFKTLPDDVVLDWFKKGFMAMMYYAMQSHSNWRYLLEKANKNDSGNAKKK